MIARTFARVAAAAAIAVAAALPARAAVDIQEVTSPGGITAWLVEDQNIPFVALEIRFRGGTSLDAPGKRGAVRLMTALLEEGAGELDAQAFARATEGIAADFDYDAGDDAVSVSARFLTETRDEAVTLLRASLVEPRFDADATERVRAQAISAIRSDLQDPGVIASRAFDRLAFGDHPYGTSPDGTPESVAALTREDLVAAHRAALARDRIYVGAAGDITPEELGVLLDRLLGDLPAEGAQQPADVSVEMPGGVEVVEFDTPQSVAVFGHAGIPRDHEDFFEAFVLNQIVGAGGFESRLMQEVREKRGLTYGVYSYLAPKDHAALYLGRVASANDRIAEAVAVIRDEWRKVAGEGVTAEELESAKTYLTGAYPLRFDGNGPIANILVAMQLDDLPIDYVETRNDRVRAVTLEDVNRVASELFDPERLTFVVAGQPEGLDSVGEPAQ
ncbi:insulinase family protein [Rhodosalinus halophilus]|uniref:Insulinase family protein n=1 Tax=Rhodosalinus halophilus TaxID=2259333 RepID=A0A365UC02_9RHOB|nr:pitrilysin family protein [Rhodosalinus halophilus]RBI85847.1 insulinase family protein [Rhodosalinus halophilus]